MSKSDGIPDSDRAGDAPLPRETTAFFGHASAEADLLDAYRNQRLPHAWIIGGSEGIGKATLAWRFARFLLAHPLASSIAVQSATTLHLDPTHSVARKIASGGHGNVFCLRREWNDKTKKMRNEISADSVREAMTLFRQSAAEGGWRVCIVDSAEDLNRNSANALLKLVEEPPAQSLFLIISQKPGQILPTLRSRCRKLLLQSLPEAQIVSAISEFASSIGYPGPAAIQQAATRADGSVREALRLLDPETVGFDRKLNAALSQLPKIDWREVHAIADAVAGRSGEAAYDVLVRSVFAYLNQKVRAGALAQVSPMQLAPLADAWEKLREKISITDAINLDKKALVLGIFSELAVATRHLVAV